LKLWIFIKNFYLLIVFKKSLNALVVELAQLIPSYCSHLTVFHIKSACIFLAICTSYDLPFTKSYSGKFTAFTDQFSISRFQLKVRGLPFGKL
jgi:hypothetical protein